MELSDLARSERILQAWAVTHPLLRFAVLGALLFAGSRLRVAPADIVEAPVVLRAAEVEGLRRGFLGERARLPDAAELAALVQARIDDEVLFREALARGLDRSDPVVERRLAENARFLSADDEDGALTADLRLRDPVVRRRLVNRMRLWIASEARGDGPSQEALANTLASQADALRAPPRVRITQQYLGPAAALPLPRSFPLLSEEMLARSFGAEFARRVFSLPVGSWCEGVPSIHGVHRVRVDAREEGELPALDRVAGRLRDAWQEARDAEAIQAALVKLRQRHPVRVEGMETTS